MPAVAYDSFEEALQAANDRIDALVELSARQEAVNDVFFGLMVALVSTHPDRDALKEAWARTRSIVMANSQLHPGDNAALAVKAEQARDQISIIDELFAGN